MLKVEKNYKHYQIETDDTMLIVILENAIEEHIKNLQHLLDNNLFEYRHEEIKEEIARYKEYLKIL